MIYEIEGNLFDSRCQTLVNAVNCVGVMGGGIALEFKNRMPPAYFVNYQLTCDYRILRPGHPFLFRSDGYGQDILPWVPWVLNFPTKDDWRNPSQLQYIEDGLRWLVTPVNDTPRILSPKWGVTSIAFPALGCGLGGLTWEEVRPRMHTYLSALPITVEIYLPQK
jgi:hypothetical protein